MAIKIETKIQRHEQRQAVVALAIIAPPASIVAV